MSAEFFVLYIPYDLKTEKDDDSGVCTPNTPDEVCVTGTTPNDAVNDDDLIAVQESANSAAQVAPTENVANEGSHGEVDSQNKQHEHENKESEEAPLLNKSTEEDTEEKSSSHDSSVEKATPVESDGSATTENSNNNAANDDVKGPDYWTLADALQSLLESQGVFNDVWQQTDAESHWCITILVEKEDCDALLHRLTSFGFGSIPDTSISVFPSSFHRLTPGKYTTDDEEDSNSVQTIIKDNDTQNVGFAQNANKDSEEAGSLDEFVKSIRARLTVTEVVERISAGSGLTFDFIVLIALAGVIAGLGLAENSSVILVASMLISPLMGPILGWVFGVVIKNRSLWVMGIKNELIGLLLCVIIGFLLGLVIGPVNLDGAGWGNGGSWPTSEMSSRGLTRSLWVGILIALPSGAGVALAVLGGNAGSLVGVAISASLLPPAVNAGMLWAYAIVAAIHPPTLVESPVLQNIILATNMSINSTDVPYNITPTQDSIIFVSETCQPLYNNDYKFTYSCWMPTEAFILGLVSLFLTILNILCICVMGICVLKLKEVAPHTAANPDQDIFWKKDLKIARNAYKTISSGERDDLSKMAKDFAAKYKPSTPSTDTGRHWTVHGLEGQRMNEKFQDILKSAEQDSTYQDIVQRLPQGSHRPFLRHRHASMDNFGRLINGPSTPSIYLTAKSEHHESPHENLFFKDLPKSPKSYNKNIATFEYPSQPPKHRRQVRGLKRMTSLPEMILAVPAKKKTTSGRFQVTTIAEEDEETDGKVNTKVCFMTETKSRDKILPV